MQLNDRKEAFSRAYVSALCAAVGCSCASWSVDDDSVDVTLKKRVAEAPLPSAMLDVQLKATARATVGDDGVSFPLKTKNVHDLRQKSHYPRILVVVTLPGDDASAWLDQPDESRLSLLSCAYWASVAHLPVSDNQTSLTVRLERILTADVLTDLMERIGHERPLVDP